MDLGKANGKDLRPYREYLWEDAGVVPPPDNDAMWTVQLSPAEAVCVVGVDVAAVFGGERGIAYLWPRLAGRVVETGPTAKTDVSFSEPVIESLLAAWEGLVREDFARGRGHAALKPPNLIANVTILQRGKVAEATQTAYVRCLVDGSSADHLLPPGSTAADAARFRPCKGGYTHTKATALAQFLALDVRIRRRAWERYGKCRKWASHD